jgi:hypothetical protein
MESERAENIAASSSPDGVSLSGGHQFGMRLQPFLANLCDARATIAAKYQAEKPRNEVGELPTIAWVGRALALGARPVVVFHATGAHLAPGGFLVLVTAEAAATAIRVAGPTV